MKLKQAHYPRITIAVICVALTAIYAGRMIGQSHAKVDDFNLKGSQTGDVPDSVVSEIANHVGNVAGLEELIVLPSTTGKGYMVNAQIDLGPVIMDASVTSEKIQHEVGAYFTDVFSVNHNITDAQVYFIANNQIVASAGLGSKVYQKLALATNTGTNTIAASMEQLPVVNGAGENNSWFEIGEMD